MTIRTPRRRISPRTRRRYWAIREFFKRAIGSKSQPDTSIKISSSIALNVTNLKRKLFGVEDQTVQVSKNCHDVGCLQKISSEETDNEYQEENFNAESVIERSDASFERKLNCVETELLYKTSECNYKKSDESDYETKRQILGKSISSNNEVLNKSKHVSHAKIRGGRSKLEKTNEFEARLHKLKTQSAFENFTSTYSSSSFHSLAHPRNSRSHGDHARHRSDKRYDNIGYRSISPGQLKDKSYKDHSRRCKQGTQETIHENKLIKTKKQKHSKSNVDEDFIADIIQRQYKPVKLFGKRESSMSQFSAPICRDQEYSFRHYKREDSRRMCSHCHEDQKHGRYRYNDLGDIRSVCDARLYGSKRKSHSKHRHTHPRAYNDSDIYDLVPVKEKSSPKSRRKFVEDNYMTYQAYREVPPSPRTLRPRLNLETQHFRDCDDYMGHAHIPRQKCSPSRSKRIREIVVPRIESDIISDVDPIRCSKRRSKKTFRPAKVQVGNPEKILESTSSMSKLPSVYINEQSNEVNTSLDKTQETGNTDKTLGEIKAILQNFLQEIKKETTPSPSNKSENTIKSGEQNSNHRQNGINGNDHIGLGPSFNNPSLGQCNIPPYLPTAFGGPCCYPMVYPVNCAQNRFVMPNPSFSYTHCANVPQEHLSDPGLNEKRDTFNPETEELIREIYKFVAQGSNATSNKIKENNFHGKNLTSRSVGENFKKISKHDAKVGTPNLKYSSKSCEAIVSKTASENYYNTSASYSDTVLEKLSLQLTESETELKAMEDEKKKNKKISRAFNSFGLFKKKKRDIIEERDETESLHNEEVKPKQTRPRSPYSPFKQQTMNYMMYQQDYYNATAHKPSQSPPEYHTNYHPPYNPRMAEYPQGVGPDYTNKILPHSQRHGTNSPYISPQPSAPPYKAFDYGYPPEQVPLCLKEIEVKSTATQSERKLTTFQRFKQRIKPPARMPKYEDPQKNCSTQTAEPPKDNTPKWLKKWQEKAMQEKNMGMDPKKFSLKTQFELEQKNNTMRNAMIKKLFYKRNPFSPRNLLVKTIIGTDNTPINNAPPVLFKPKLWF